MGSIIFRLSKGNGVNVFLCASMGPVQCPVMLGDRKRWVIEWEVFLDEVLF